MENGGFMCPHCGAGLDAAPASTPQDVACPHCGGLSIIPADDAATAQADETRTTTESHRDDELNALRIRQLAGSRRAAYRSRSYCVVAALVCVVAAVQLTWTGITLLRANGFGARHAAYLPVAALAAWGAGFFYGKAVALDREAKRSSLPEARGEPDFTPLGDGSQRWKDLEDIR